MRAIQQPKNQKATPGNSGLGVSVRAAQPPAQPGVPPAPGQGQNSGLDWSIVSKTGETRPVHVGKHMIDDKSKPKHGIFNNNAVNTINNAWGNRGQGQVIHKGSTDEYVIPCANAGTEGGSNGDGSVLDYVRIITRAGTNQIITGFPSKP